MFVNLLFKIEYALSVLVAINSMMNASFFGPGSKGKLHSVCSSSLKTLGACLSFK